MKKKILSVISAAAVILGSVSVIGAADTAALSPRASVVLTEGYMDGIVGIPTADFVAAQFDGNVAVVNPKGDTISGETAVPAESVVKSGDAELCRVLVYGDASCDGKINLGDASAMLKKIAKWGVNISTGSADVTADGKMNLSDVSMLLQYLAKWDVALSSPSVLDIVAEGAPVYKLLSNDAETDAAFIAAVKDACGVELVAVSEAAESERYITVGKDLSDKYDFIDGTAASAVDSDKAYIDIYNENVYIVADGKGVEFAAKEFAGQLVGDTLTLPRGYAGPITHMTERSSLYWDAVANILETKPAVDGTNGMNEDILVAISNANYTAPKNYIFMIGDGMGKNIVTAAEYCHKEDLYGGKMTMNYLPNIGLQSTYSSDYQITDSAAGGTALSTGHKTGNGTIAMKGDHSETYKTLLELAAEKGMSTGVIATKSVTDATPASFTAHVDGRSEETEIARQQLTKLTDGTLDLILGGGASFYEDSTNSGVMAAAKEKGLTYTNDWGMVQGSNLPIAGIFTSHEMATDGNPDEPHIADMTDFALNILSEDENGFFIMIEGSKIDTYGHNNDFGTQVDETYEFDCAVAVALRFVALNPDTVLIITADHETGELAIPAEPTEDNIRSGSRYASGGHHWVDVPVYAVGYRTEELARVQENTDIAIFTASLMGEEDFGAKSTVYDLFDLDDMATETAMLALNNENKAISTAGDGIRVAFGGDFKNLFLPVDKFVPADEDTMNVGAVRVTYTNKSSSPKMIPMLSVKCDNGSFVAGERITYIAPGETRVYTYCLDVNAKIDGSFNSAYEFILSMRSGSADLVISDIDVVNRPFNR